MPDDFVPQPPLPDEQGYWHYTYITTDTETGQWYGGKHTTKRLDDGYHGSGWWIKKHPQPKRLITEIIAFHDNEIEAYLAEAFLITEDMIIGNDLCMNRWAGGLGGSSEGIKRILRDPVVRARKVAARLRSMADPVIRERCTRHSKISNADPAVKAKIAEGVSSAWKDPIVRERWVASLRAVANSPERRHQISTGVSLAWTIPEVREKWLASLSEGQKRRYENPEQREISRQRAVERWLDPLMRAIMTEAQYRPDVVTKRLAAHLGKKRSPTACANMSNAQLQRFSDPAEVARMTELQRKGRTQETGRKIGHARRELAKKCPRRWITNGIEDTLIPVSDAVPEGWKYGRRGGWSKSERASQQKDLFTVFDEWASEADQHAYDGL